MTTSAGSATLEKGYEYISTVPTIGFVVPASGPAAGGQHITIYGTNFDPDNTQVTIGGNTVTQVLSTLGHDRTTTIDCETPTGSGGIVDIVVTTADWIGDAFGRVMSIIYPTSSLGPSRGRKGRAHGGIAGVGVYPVYGKMPLGGHTARILIAAWTCCAGLYAQQAAVTGRVVDENGGAVGGAQVSWRAAGGGVVTASSDPAGNFRAVLPAAGEYALRVERPGFFVFTDGRHAIEAGAQQVTIRLNHLQEFADKIDVTYSPPAIDPQQTSERKELANTEIQGVPYPAPQDFRNALPLLNGVVQDNAGRVHFNGGDTNQANYTLDGFNISDPVTGRLETRINIESIQSMDLENSRYAADNGRGSTGVLDLKTKMGDDRWRFGGTNFIPGVSTDGGLYVNKWTPRLEFSGPDRQGPRVVPQRVGRVLQRG